MIISYYLFLSHHFLLPKLHNFFLLRLFLCIYLFIIYRFLHFSLNTHVRAIHSSSCIFSSSTAIIILLVFFSTDVHLFSPFISSFLFPSQIFLFFFFNLKPGILLTLYSSSFFLIFIYLFFLSHIFSSIFHFKRSHSLFIFFLSIMFFSFIVYFHSSSFFNLCIDHFC